MCTYLKQSLLFRTNNRSTIYHNHYMPTKKYYSSRPTVLQIVWGMVAAFYGVQNSQNHERDFAYLEQVRFKPYIIIGVVLTLTILLALYTIDQVILG